MLIVLHHTARIGEASVTLEFFDALQRVRLIDDVFTLAFISGSDDYENLKDQLAWLDVALVSTTLDLGGTPVEYDYLIVLDYKALLVFLGIGGCGCKAPCFCCDQLLANFLSHGRGSLHTLEHLLKQKQPPLLPHVYHLNGISFVACISAGVLLRSWFS